MFSIGEFSRITGLSVKTLRFYHEKGILVPAAIDDQSGYRYYDERNIEVARVIIALRDIDFSLDDIAEIIRTYDDDSDILNLLDRQKQSIAEHMRHYADVARRIERLIEMERQSREQSLRSPMKVEERTIEPLLVGGMRMKGKYSDCGRGFAALYKQLGRYAAGKPLNLYYDGEYRDDDANFEPCLPLRKPVPKEGISVRELPGGRCVSLLHQGPYEELGRSYSRVLRYIKQKGLVVVLPTREVYHKGPGMIFRGNPKKYVTEIQLMLAE
jgi:DNA-binding transcriptional MerR regulator/effector-binding domain-containing protein